MGPNVKGTHYIVKGDQIDGPFVAVYVFDADVAEITDCRCALIDIGGPSGQAIVEVGWFHKNGIEGVE